MSGDSLTISGGPIFDGQNLQESKIACFEDGVFIGFAEQSEKPRGKQHICLGGDILSPAYVDLQVNGGGGVMFNSEPSVAGLVKIAAAHRRLGTSKILPTLITDTPTKTKAAIDAVEQAIQQCVPGIFGLHLEGPHLSIARKGAHDANLIRPMKSEDLDLLLDAKARLPVLKVTIAPEHVTEDQVRVLNEAGVVISLGHTDADFDTCLSYVKAGARCATHLFNAMSQMGNRAPGLVGCVLDCGELSAGLIADGVHVHPATMRAAWAAKKGPASLFLVSDSMAVAGTNDRTFELEGRLITRREGQLRLADGTLAGADLDLTRAISTLVNYADVPLEKALAAATGVPAKFAGLTHYGLRAGLTRLEDLIRVQKDLSGIVDLIQANRPLIQEN